ncbi:MAG: hypothetical protein OK457_04660, partial [Thaumarchaeota archaeon]|nr:hypothetical protein [Nitrososphaerota archaeon]
VSLYKILGHQTPILALSTTYWRILYSNANKSLAAYRWQVVIYVIIGFFIAMTTVFGTIYATMFLTGNVGNCASYTQGSILPSSVRHGPSIVSVSPINTDITQTMEIKGNCFGTAPQTIPYGDGSVWTVACNNSASGSIAFHDFGQKGEVSSTWGAGIATCSRNGLDVFPGIYLPPSSQSQTDSGGNPLANSIFLISWNDTAIILGGFGPGVGNRTSPNQQMLYAGDAMAIKVFSASELNESTVNVTIVPPS